MLVGRSLQIVKVCIKKAELAGGPAVCPGSLLKPLPLGGLPALWQHFLGFFCFFFLQLHFKKFNFTYVYLKRAHELGLGREPALFSGMAYRRDRNYCIVRCMAIVKFHIFYLL